MRKWGLPFFFGVISSLGVVFFIHIKGSNMEIIRTLEPLLIAPEFGDEQGGELENENYYVLPRGVHLYVDEGMAEGHVRYRAYFYHKGHIAHEEVPMLPKYQGTFFAPSWLHNVDSDTLARMFKRFPLTRKDVEEAVRANEITRDDLVNIIRALPE